MKISRSAVIRLAAVIAALLAAVLIPAVVLSGSQKQTKVQAQGFAAYAPGPQENESLASMEAYMAHRVSYPTGRFDQRWWLEAAREAKLVRPGVPSGSARARAATGADSTKSPLAMNPSAFTSLGPQPQESDPGICEGLCFSFGRVAGRVNAIAVDPTTTTPGQILAYFASDGGGVWKSVNPATGMPNCCNAGTTWVVTTDGPLISTTAIDDLFVDPTNRWVYAATGDISFGSFAFGSSGILRSKDQGATWEILGRDVFTPALPVPPPPANYPQYQAVSKVKVDPNNSNTIIAATKTGLFFSYDSGTNWTGPCYTNSFTTQRQDITDMIVRDEGTTATIFAAVGARGFPTTVQPNLGQNGANGIYTATVPASGCPATWNLITTKNNGWPDGTGEGVPCDPAVGNITSKCSGPKNDLGRIEMAIAPSNPQVIYAEVQAVDGHGPAAPPDTQQCGVIIRTTLIAPQSARGCFLGLWRTTDGGVTWTQRANHLDLFNLATAGPCGEDTPQNWYNQGLAVDPSNPDVLFMDAIDIWKSTNGGDTLVDISCGYYTSLVNNPVHVDNHSLLYVDSNTMLAGNDGGIYVSNNATNVPNPAAPGLGNPPSFQETNNTVGTIEFYSGDISTNFATGPSPVIVGGAQDNGSSSFQWPNPAAIGCVPACNWQQRIGGDGMAARMEAKQGLRVYMESQNGNIRTSVTGHVGVYSGSCGLVACSPTWPWAGDRKSFVFPYELDKHDCVHNNPSTTTCDHIIAGSYRVWESVTTGGIGATNLPVGFYAASPDLTKGTLADRSFINQLAYANTDNRVAIVGTNDGNVQYGFNLGTNVAWAPGCAGTTCAQWVDVTDGNAVLPNRPIQDVTIKPDNTLVGYAAVGGFDQNTPGQPGHVFQVTCTATCGSFTWANKTGNLPNIPANAIIANPNIPSQVFVGTDWGLFFTDNINAVSPVWFNFRNGLPATMIWDMAIDRGATTLAVFTRGRGAFAWPLPTTPISGQILFSDDLNDTHGWTVSHEIVPVSETDPVPPTPLECNTNEWHLTQLDVHSPAQAWTNNPYTTAANAEQIDARCNNYLTSPAFNVPSGTGDLKLRFWEHHFTEGPQSSANPCNPPDGDPPCDFGEVEISSDGGANWTLVSPHYEGGTANDAYVQAVLSLPNVTGSIKLRFKFSSDFFAATPPFTGWSVDDVEVRGNVPTSVTIASFTAKASKPKGVQLRWRTASEAGTLGYNVWRFTGGKGVKVNRSLIAAKGTVARGAVYSLVDRKARRGATYTYRLQVVAKDGKRSFRAGAVIRVRR